MKTNYEIQVLTETSVNLRIWKELTYMKYWPFIHIRKDQAYGSVHFWHHAFIFFFQRTYLKAMVPKNAISMNQRKAAPILDQPWSELVRANDMKPKDWFTQHLAIPMTHRHPWQQWMRMKLRVTRGMITSLEGRSIQSRGRTDRGRWQRRIIKERKCRGTEVGRWMREGQTLQVHLAWRKNTHWSSLSY